MNFVLFSNGKINLYLRVLYKRKDQYHEIESIFVPIPIFDLITLKILNFSDYASSIEDFSFQTINKINLSNAELFEEVTEKRNIKKNLIYQVFDQLLKYKIKIPKLEIYLEKHIPAGSGIGSGSSNAGTLLRFMIKQKWIDFSTGMQIAESLGSDIPFFLYNRISYVSGKGEKILPLKKSFKQRLYCILCLNSYSISTKEAYQKLNRDYIPVASKFDLKLFRKNPFNFLINDFEEVAYEIQPKLKEIKELFLQTQCEKVLLTGSGSGIFAVYENHKKMIEAYNVLKKMENREQNFYSFVL